MDSARDYLNDIDRFGRLLDGYRPREPQLRMADAVAEAIRARGTLLVEAQTGTGKTLAYLLPALLSDGPTLVSTGTKSLQDQLFFKDLPVVLKALSLPRKAALLKGRANYLCPYRLELHQEEARFLTRETAEQLQVVAHWAGRTKSGDIAELKQLPEDAPVWPWVTSTADNCLGTECPKYSECPLMNARKEAQEADLVVVNHHLFFADAALRGEGVSELLPSANTVIFDEAHQLPEVAAAFFGDSLSTRQIQELGRDALSEAAHSALDLAALNQHISALDKAGQDLRLSLGEQERRAPWSEVAELPAVREAGEALLDALIDLNDFLEPQARASRGLEACARRASEHVLTLKSILDANGPNRVYWFETFRRTVVLHSTPLSVAGQLRAQREKHPCAWILTSATLSVAGRFEHLQKRLGLDEAETLSLESPFDFKRQAVFYVPENLPAPSSPDYTASLTRAMIPVIRAAEGRTFFLFTSHRALREAAALLREEKLEYPLLVQGEAGRRELLDEFRRLGNAVLLGTSSFWEGIDVRGEALSCVIIDKLPFGSPGDPVAAARIEHINANGGNAFRDYQLPQAVLALRQGAGRLIRDPNDHGLLVVGDPRLVTKGYGRLFLDSLPGMTRTRKVEVVQRFFPHIARLQAERLAQSKPGEAPPAPAPQEPTHDAHSGH
ncbi:ATP-dependent helicase [Alcanivorax sp. 521-1]|uniref:DNA 5'-3' helicase n=1 Tax=Alloalcanivorax profundimaris TaxID=2735259 RepID=A0ABS0ATX2_9GAMM|nr:ATP-dependent DNA helicase [Alloalcanivorax profundimaris]MAO59609.1 helicase [Alcanivorax sp.]MBF5057067.1 ATP-dependent helicase [Alloalcanivorax profundimaris]MBI54196.1 helicase [Alcanivorax sp.]MBU58425.1 helicase [Alcanivorax sp.]HCE40808.1 helicase [Alcanivorax sp.]